MRPSTTPGGNRSSKRRRELKGSGVPTLANNHQPNDEYRVGPGRPPREFQFKPGQSGNPMGAKRKTTSIAPDLKAMLERSLRNTVKLGNGERESGSSLKLQPASKT
jgi:Family of unknown function (DUF5681)